MLTILGGSIGLVIVVAAALWAAIAHNGPAVLDSVDRIAGGSRGVSRAGAAAYGADPAQKLHYYAPVAPEKGLPMIVFLHGGSWRSGSPDNYGFVARALAPEGFFVALAGYRLGVAGRYPAMLADTAAAIARARSDAASFGGDPDCLILVGHSAGAYNIVQATLERRWLEEAGVPPHAIKGLIGLAGPYDFHPFTSHATKLAFESVRADGESQPVNHARADAPPMLLVHGERDTLVRPRNSHALAMALSAAGAVVETVFHPDMNHNAPLISLASPWRGRRTVASRIAEFAQRVASVSVPVQAEKP